MRKIEKLKHFKYTLKTKYNRACKFVGYYWMTIKEQTKYRCRLLKIYLEDMKTFFVDFVVKELIDVKKFKDDHLKGLERFLINRKNDFLILLDKLLVCYHGKLQNHYGKKIFKLKLKLVKLYDKKKLYKRIKHDPTL